MKPTKVRNQQIYRASKSTLSKRLGSLLSKDLRKKYGKRSSRVLINDSVKVVRGEYKGVEGKVTQVSSEKNGIAIEGIKKEKLKGGNVDVYIPASNLIITNLNMDDHWRKTKFGGKKPKLTPKDKESEKLEKSKEKETKSIVKKTPKKIQKPKEKETTPKNRSKKSKPKNGEDSKSNKEDEN